MAMNSVQDIWARLDAIARHPSTRLGGDLYRCPRCGVVIEGDQTHLCEDET